jgi:DNA-directed RNA polymerase subunit RPC12/RpoP
MVTESSSRLETREVVCTHCDHPIEIPATAMSVNCRHCHRRVIIEDLKIKAYHAVIRLATAGRVEVLKKAQVVAQVRVNDLIVDGAVKGNVVALGLVKVGKKGQIAGDVACRRLSVEPGAKLDGFFRVDPAFAPEPQSTDDDSDDDYA